MLRTKEKKLVLGMGINNSDTPIKKNIISINNNKVVWRCPFYKTWAHMLKRCYDKKYHNKQPTYIKCEVDPIWLLFLNFKSWMITKKWENKELDKDILFIGNKLYSPENCAFVTKITNRFVNDQPLSRGNYLIGVDKPKNRNFRARCRNPFTGKSVTLGYFNDEHKAHLAWKAEKHEHACKLADLETDPRIQQALRTRFA